MQYEDFLKQALDIFHLVQKDIDPNEFNQLTKKLYGMIEHTPLHRLFNLEDLRWAIKDDMFFRWSTTIKNTSDETFVERLKSTILTTKAYDFYIPIYCLYGFPKNMTLATSAVTHFEDLPHEVKEHYLQKWQFRFKINKENYHRTEEEYINLKKTSAFLFLTINSNGNNKAMEYAKNSAEDVLHIIRFVYDLNFNLIDIAYWVRGTKDSGDTGVEGLAGLPFCGRAQYEKLWGESIRIISNIFNKKDPCDIEKRVRRLFHHLMIQKDTTNKSGAKKDTKYQGIVIA